MGVLAAWVHSVDPVAFSIGPLEVRWYGLAYLLGFVISAVVLRILAKRGLVRVPPDRVLDFVLYVGLGVIIGGRLGYCVLYRPELLVDFDLSRFPWWGVLRINEGGMASHGGIIGLVLAAWLFARQIKQPLLHLMDLLALVGPPGLLLGRLANFVNGELLGKVVAGPGEAAPRWSVKFPQELLERPGEQFTDADAMTLYTATGSAFTDSFEVVLRRAVQMIQEGNPDVRAAVAPMLQARHPSQLYQALMEGLLLLVVLWWIWRKPRRDGVVASWFLILYGLGRVATEIWRLPDAHFVVGRPWGLSRGQWYSIAVAVCGIALLFVSLRRKDALMSGGWMGKGRGSAPVTVKDDAEGTVASDQGPAAKS